MAKKRVSPIMTWIFWSILVLAAFLLITWDYFVEGFVNDSSRITWLIMGFFIYGFASSFRVALHLQSEFKSLRAMMADQRIAAANSSDAAAMFDAAMERVRRGDRIELRTLVSAYGARLKARIDNVGVVAGMLITIGLLGTVVGLIMTVDGLDTVLQSNSADFGGMKSGLTKAVSGMGTAFYTTFIGALLGGVVLKVLGAEMRKAALQLVADTLTFGELFISPQFDKKASEALVALEDRMLVLNEQIGTLGASLSQIIDTIDSKQTALATGLGSLVEAVEATSAQATDRTQALVAGIADAIETSSRQADERLAATTSTIELSTAKSTESATALADAIRQAIEGTTRQADERLGTLAATIEQTNTEAAERAASLVSAIEAATRQADERLGTVSASVGGAIEETSRSAAAQLQTVADTVVRNVADTNESMAKQLAALIDTTNAKADERIATLAAAVQKSTEETNKLADERLQLLLSAMRAATHAAHEEADKQLAGFVENVEKAVDKTRHDAEQRLSAKAADLAGKLSEAATMISGLVAAADTKATGEGE
jgi:hypothetical protein